MVSRSELLERILKDGHDTPSVSKRCVTWDDFETFQMDNLAEVEEKMSSTHNQIWGKLIIMEKGTRTAKAYLRNSVIIVNGSSVEFNGTMMGVRRFRNPHRDSITEMNAILLGKGVEISVDEIGDVRLRNLGGRTMNAFSQGKKHLIGPHSTKVFDLRQFKSSIRDANRCGESTARIRRHAMIDIMLDSSCAPLQCPLWLCVIHLIAVELTSLLMTSSAKTSSLSSESSSLVSTTSVLPPSSTGSFVEIPPLFDRLYDECQRIEDVIKKAESSDESSRQTSSAAHSRSTSNLSKGTSSPDYSIPTEWTSIRSSLENQNPEQKPHPFARNSSYPTHMFESEPKNRNNQAPPQQDRGRTENRGEREGAYRKRGGVKKILEREKSCGPLASDSRSNIRTREVSRPRSSSIVNLRTLSEIRRPVYFTEQLRNGGGQRDNRRK